MLIYILLIALVCIILTSLLCCLTCLSCLGVTGLFKTIINKLSWSSFDHRFTGEMNTLNDECFICLERIKNEVTATCQHAYCGNFTFTKPNVLSTIFNQSPMRSFNALPVGKISVFYLGDLMPKVLGKKHWNKRSANTISTIRNNPV